MFSWLAANAANLLVCALLLLAIGLAIRTMVRDKRAGKASCGGSCGSCGACGRAGGCPGCAPTSKH